MVSLALSSANYSLNKSRLSASKKLLNSPLAHVQ